MITQTPIPTKPTPMTYEQNVAIDLPADEAATLLPILHQSGFSTQSIQRRDLDWQTIVVVIRDLGEIAGREE
jgi:hypothetical protein